MALQEPLFVIVTRSINLHNLVIISSITAWLTPIDTDFTGNS